MDSPNDLATLCVKDETEVKQLPKPLPKTSTNNIVAELNQLGKSFASKIALNKLTLQIRGSEVLAILGSNGAGKTPLINILLGRLSYAQGDMSILGQAPGTARNRQ